jgi:hypothetical protein
VDNGGNINRLGANPSQVLAGATGPTEFDGTVLVDSTATDLSGEARAGPDPGQGLNAEMA